MKEIGPLLAVIIPLLIGGIVIWRALAARRKPNRTVYPIMHGSWIEQYAEELFIVYDPMDGGSSILCATRTLDQAYEALKQLSLQESGTR